MKCKHQFFAIEQTSKSRENAPALAFRYDLILGVRVGCVECGEVKTVWADGSITLDTQGKKNGAGDSKS